MYGACYSSSSSSASSTGGSHRTSRSLYGSYGAPVGTITHASPFRYQVEEGDTLEIICQKTGTSAERICSLNSIVFGSSNNPKRVKLYAGQQLIVEDANQVSLPPPPDCIDNGWGQMHVVRAGDSIQGIASLYNTTEDVIRQDNRQYFPAGERGILFPGQLLHIRMMNGADTNDQVTSASQGASFSHYKSHQVTSQDTFDSICQQYQISFSRLLEINRGKFPIGQHATLKIGEELIVPDVEATKLHEKMKNIAEIKLTKQIHIVQQGETPEEIANRYHMTRDEIREWNRVYFPKGYRGEIQPGYKLVVKKNMSPRQREPENEQDFAQDSKEEEKKKLKNEYLPIDDDDDDDVRGRENHYK
jgi:LysM repeat protein